LALLRTASKTLQFLWPLRELQVIPALPTSPLTDSAFFPYDKLCRYAAFATLQVQATSITFGVVNCTNEILCPGLQNYPYDCCWRHASDQNTKFVFQNAGSVPQSSSTLDLSPLCKASAMNLFVFECILTPLWSLRRREKHSQKNNIRHCSSNTNS